LLKAAKGAKSGVYHSGPPVDPTFSLRGLKVGFTTLKEAWSIDQRFFFVAKIRHLAIKKKCPATWSVQFFEKSPKKIAIFLV